ncbi:MAG TPA: hypothetical protein VKC58_03340 [Myxococcales bacterium]|nr:hypothetical protein [Myxococcales bacterium]
MSIDRNADLVRHFLAAIAYRTQKALRGAAPSFASFRAAPKVRTPHELVRHMSGVLSYARSFFGDAPDPLGDMLPTFEGEILRFHGILEALGAHLAQATPLRGATLEQLLQGPLSDAMTHAGQLALLRRLSGDPVPPENFRVADIRIGNLGPNQALPGSPDEEWPEAP